MQRMVEVSSSRRHFFPVLFFALLLVLFFPALFFQGRVFLIRMGDPHLGYFSWVVYFQQMSQNGIWPLWNTFSFAGCPFGVGAVSHVSLVNLLVLLVNDAPTAWNIRILVNVFLAAFGTYLYMRKMEVSEWGALIAGILFAFLPSGGSYLDGWPFFLPLGLWLLEEFHARRRKFILILLVLNFLVMILNALPQYTLYTGFIFAAYAVARFRSGSGFLVLIFAGGLASFYLFRLLELLSLSSRGKMWFVNVLLPTHLVNMVFPFFYESPFRPEGNFFFSKLFGAITQRCFNQDKIDCLYAPYVTIAGLSFALYAWRLKGPLRFFRTVALWIFVYLMTFPLLAPFYRKIPILAQLPRVERLYLVLTFCFSVLAGWGADKILKRHFRLKPIAFFYAVLCGILLAGLGITRLIFHVFHDPIRNLLTQYIQEHIFHNAAYQASEAFYLERIDQFFSFVNSWTRWNDPSIVVSLVLISVFLLLLTAWRFGKIPKAFFAAAILLLIVLDILFIFRISYNGTSSRSEITPRTDAIRFLQKQPGIFRIATILEEPVFGVGRERDVLAPNLNLHYSLSGVEGYDPMLLGRYSDFVKNFQNAYEQDPAMILSGPESGFDYKMMDFLNVRYFFTKIAVTPKKDLPLVFQDTHNKVYLNPQALPRAFLVTDYRIISQKQDILKAVRDPSFEFQTSVILEDKPRLSEKPARSRFDPASVSFERYEPDRIKLRVNASQDSILVLSENYYPGWKAFLDGLEVPIFRSDYTFRSVEVPKGQHSVEFIFQPASFRWGLAVSFIFLLGGIGILIKMPGCGPHKKGEM
ncbi:MAG: YfhO family protein [Candidatus Omnitrophota bacterium]